MKTVDKCMVFLAVIGLLTLLGVAGAVETAQNLSEVSIWPRVLIGFGLMMPLAVKYLWKEYIG